MKLEPLGRYSPRPVALLTPAGRSLGVETETGSGTYKGARDVGRALEQLKPYCCFVAGNLAALRLSTDARQWTMRIWRRRPVRMIHQPTDLHVTSLRSCLEGSTDPFGDLQTFLRWLEAYRVPPGPISGMAMGLFRASLAAPLHISFNPAISRRAFFGGRQEGDPGEHRGMISWDIRAAYPAAMARDPYALTLREVRGGTNLDPGAAGLAEARVLVPSDLRYPPLPVRVADNAIQFQWGEIEGVWTWRELHAARGMGCDVEVLRSWAPARSAPIFSGWWDMARTGRDLPGRAAALAKAVATSLWGQFGMGGDHRAEVRWEDPEGELAYEVPSPTGRMPHQWAAHIAAETTARVRVQTLLEGIYPTGAEPCHVDTDGIIAAYRDPSPANVGEGYGEWRAKETASIVEIRAPQLYRYKNRLADPRWKYVAAGMTPAMARNFFERRGGPPSRVAWLNTQDVVLPRGRAGDQQDLERSLAEALARGAA